MAIKLDPNRPQKVFTAEQIIEALTQAFLVQQNHIRDSAIEQGREPSFVCSLMIGQLNSALHISDEFYKALGMEGEDGPYLDKRKL